MRVGLIVLSGTGPSGDLSLEGTQQREISLDFNAGKGLQVAGVKGFFLGRHFSIGLFQFSHLLGELY